MKKLKILFLIMAMPLGFNVAAEDYEEYVLDNPDEVFTGKSAIIDYDAGDCLTPQRELIKEPAVIRFYAEEQGVRALISEEFCKNGKLDGVAKFYYPNGRLQQEVPFKLGKPHGKVKHYAKTGKLIRSETFQKGVMTSSSEHVSLNDPK
ncbi:MAG: hypothetical protein LBG61_06985 [Burkholderiales bacterium]|jgi:hypothetical protein|nr:hypothetical protein [Burkholderiales bacterium]